MHGNKGRFFISRATKSGQIQRLFYIPYILQLGLQHSLDTQIFILALRHYSSLITSTGRNLQEIILQAIFCAIGPQQEIPMGLELCTFAPGLLMKMSNGIAWTG